jgi:hypothetical protein
MAPFDRSIESPIARIRDLRSRAPGSVVAVAGMNELQQDAFVPSETERLLLELAASDACPDLLLISGSAGSGKSALIDRLVSAQPERFEIVVQDATHSDSPSETQATTLVRFFEPFRDGVAGPPQRPRLIAANIGLLLAFFAGLRGADTANSFTDLEAVLKHRLGVGTSPVPSVPWEVAVLNLDLRPTAGTGGLLTGMLRIADFGNADGLVAGAPRCATCEVRNWCPVRTNSVLASHAQAAAVDHLASRAAAERGRHDSPRQLWDFVARLLCGDDPFDDRDDPCDAVADAAERGDREWVWERLLPRTLFRSGGDLGARIARLDPSLQPSSQAHRMLAGAGIRPPADAARLLELDSGDAAALATGAEHLASGDVEAPDAGRALVAAGYLGAPDAWQIGDQTSLSFDQLLAEYEQFSRDDPGDYVALDGLRRLLERALGRSFGVLEADVPYLPIKAYDPRDPSRIFVEASLEYTPGIYEIVPDPPARRDPEGARLAAYRPLALTVELGGIEFAITLPVYRLLEAAATGTVASTADLERFYGLRRAVEALARGAAAANRELAVERPGTARRYQVRRTTTLGGQEVVAVQELGR